MFAVPTGGISVEPSRGPVQTIPAQTMAGRQWAGRGSTPLTRPQHPGMQWWAATPPGSTGTSILSRLRQSEASFTREPRWNEVGQDWKVSLSLQWVAGDVAAWLPHSHMLATLSSCLLVSQLPGRWLPPHFPAYLSVCLPSPASPSLRRAARLSYSGFSPIESVSSL